MDDFIKREQARADSYRLLAACFCQPERDLFLKEEVFAGLVENLRQLYPPAAEEAARMQSDFSTTQQEELVVEYAHLFVGPHELVAPPYGSVYLDGQGEVMGPSTRDVIRIYQEEGLALEENLTELPDHITVELEFLYYLVTSELKALYSGDAQEAIKLFDKQKSFLDKHLLKWAPQ
ncbi:molecular chaperone TorD family protein, partial [bacterium]|nr:molecular chaperone TorD family protein [bacterium]